MVETDSSDSNGDCGRVWGEMELPLRAVPNRCFCLFLVLWWPEVLGWMNTEGRLTSALHRGQNGYDSTLPSYCFISLLVSSQAFLGLF